MFPHSSGHRPSHWYSPPSEQPLPHSASSQWSYPVHQEVPPMKANGQHPSPQQSNPGHPDNSFRRTLLEIEDTYYRTFPAAAEAHGYRWRMGGSGKERTEEPNIGFFSHTSGMSGMTAGTYASDYGSSTSQPPPLAQASSGRGYGAADSQMGSSTVQTVSYTLAGAYQPPFPSPRARPPIGAMGHGQYFSPNIVQAESSIAGALRASDSLASSLSASYGPTPASGSLSDATRAQDAWKGAQDSFSPSYVTSNPAGTEDARVPPMGSLGYPDIPPGPVPVAPLPSVAPLRPQQPLSSAPRPISIPPSPHPDATGYYPAASNANSNSPNHPERAYHSPDPASPSSITLYPVPQAPLNHHHNSIPSWSPHHISPEPVPPREASSSRSTKRKRGKDSDKKPPLACLFCRGRKIACGPPPPDGDGKTCNQCHRRSLKCEYPAESRRGMRKEKLPNLNTGGAKVVVKNKKR